jgi:hypothetical protein
MRFDGAMVLKYVRKFDHVAVNMMYPNARVVLARIRKSFA